MRFILKRVLLSVLLSLVSSFFLNVQAQQWNAGASITQAQLDQFDALNYNGLPYRFLLPGGYNSSQNYPLLVSMHGGSGIGDDNESQMLHWTANFVNGAWSTDFKCVTIIPQSANGWHQSTADKNNVFALIDKICEDYSIDENRIYIIGHSGGAFGIWQMLAMNPDRFAGAICSAGGADINDCSKYKDVPIWNFHGDADTTIPVDYSRNIFNEMVRIGGNLKYSELPGKGHGCSWVSFAREGTNNDGPYPTQFASEQVDKTTSLQWDWLFRQSKTTSLPLSVLDSQKTGSNAKLKIYPNPAQQTVNIEVENSVNADSPIIIYNSIGQKIKQYTLQNNRKSINVSNWSPGIYFVGVSGRSATETIIVK